LLASEVIGRVLRAFEAAQDLEGASLEKMPRRGDRRANVVEEMRSSFHIDGRLGEAENFRRSDQPQTLIRLENYP